jgi:hypothetical protein
MLAKTNYNILCLTDHGKKVQRFLKKNMVLVQVLLSLLAKKFQRFINEKWC